MTELMLAVLIALGAVLGGARDDKSLETLDTALMELHAGIKEERKDLNGKRETLEAVQDVKEVKQPKKTPLRVPGRPWAGEA